LQQIPEHLHKNTRHFELESRTLLANSMADHHKNVLLNYFTGKLVYATMTKTKNLLVTLVISKSRVNMGVIQYKIEKLGQSVGR